MTTVFECDTPTLTVFPGTVRYNGPVEYHDGIVVDLPRDLYSIALANCKLGGLYAEFGVGGGGSLRTLRMMVHKNNKLYGFDSFQGLPEPWNSNKVGHFACDPPDIAGTKLVVGQFKDTLPAFANTHPLRYFSFMHIDCDLYSSTRTIFESLGHMIVDGTCIVFDELFGYPGWENHEYRAWREFLEVSGYRHTCLARDNSYRAAMRIWR